MPLFLQSEKAKVISFIRHGTGFHNLAGEEAGPVGYWCAILDLRSSDSNRSSMHFDPGSRCFRSFVTRFFVSDSCAFWEKRHNGLSLDPEPRRPADVHCFKASASCIYNPEIHTCMYVYVHPSSRRDAKFLDAHLTPKGWAQTQLVRHHLDRHGLLSKYELVVVSPLTRTLETACGIFGVPDPEDPLLPQVAHALYPAGPSAHVHGHHHIHGGQHFGAGHGHGGVSSPPSSPGAKAGAGVGAGEWPSPPPIATPGPAQPPAASATAVAADHNTPVDSSTVRALETGPALPTIEDGAARATADHLLLEEAQELAAEGREPHSPIARQQALHMPCRLKHTQTAIAGLRAPWPAVIVDDRTPPLIATDGCRERVTPHPCDARRDLQLTRAQFPGVSFDLVKEKDPVWTGHSEEDFLQLRERAEAFLEWVEARPESWICVVTHGGFLMSVRECYLRRMHGSNSGAHLGAIRPPFNCEILTTVMGRPQLGHADIKALDYIPHF